MEFHRWRVLAVCLLAVSLTSLCFDTLNFLSIAAPVRGPRFGTYKESAGLAAQGAQVSQTKSLVWASTRSYCGVVGFCAVFVPLLLGRSVRSSAVARGRAAKAARHVMDSADDKASEADAHNSATAMGRLALVCATGAPTFQGLSTPTMLGSAPCTLLSLRAQQEETPVSEDIPFEPSQQLGALAPLGFFDPAGFTKIGGESGFRSLRAAELKHGRVAMLAAVGAVSQHYIRFPGYEKVPSGLGALTSYPSNYGFAALLLLAGVMEFSVWAENPNEEPGDFGDPFGLGMYDTDMRNREINNGRFAMFAIIGILAAELYTGKDAVQQISFGGALPSSFM